MSRLTAGILVASVGLLSLGATCTPAIREITADRAISVARPYATFEVTSVDAEKATDAGQQVWRVTFRGHPASPQHPELRQILIVLIDRRTGEVLSLAQS